jgi:hypothetical protein
MKRMKERKTIIKIVGSPWTSHDFHKDARGQGISKPTSGRVFFNVSSFFFLLFFVFFSIFLRCLFDDPSRSGPFLVLSSFPLFRGVAYRNDKQPTAQNLTSRCSFGPVAPARLDWCNSFSNLSRCYPILSPIVTKGLTRDRLIRN